MGIASMGLLIEEKTPQNIFTHCFMKNWLGYTGGSSTTTPIQWDHNWTRVKSKNTIKI